MKTEVVATVAVVTALTVGVVYVHGIRPTEARGTVSQSKSCQNAKPGEWCSAGTSTDSVATFEQANADCEKTAGPRVKGNMVARARCFQAVDEKFLLPEAGGNADLVRSWIEFRQKLSERADNGEISVAYSKELFDQFYDQTQQTKKLRAAQAQPRRTITLPQGREYCFDGECHTMTGWQDENINCLEKQQAASAKVLKAPMDSNNPSFQAANEESDKTTVRCLRIINNITKIARGEQ